MVRCKDNSSMEYVACCTMVPLRSLCLSSVLKPLEDSPIAVLSVFNDVQASKMSKFYGGYFCKVIRLFALRRPFATSLCARAVSVGYGGRSAGRPAWGVPAQGAR